MDLTAALLGGKISEFDYCTADAKENVIVLKKIQRHM